MCVGMCMCDRTSLVIRPVDVLKTFLINFSDANCFYLLPWVKATIYPSPSYFFYMFYLNIFIGIKNKVYIIFPAVGSCHKKISTGRKPETNKFLTTASVVTGKCMYRGTGFGLEVPCVYKIYGEERSIKKLRISINYLWALVASAYEICVICT